MIIKKGAIRLTVEETLKSLVLSSYGSIREFSIAINMPYSTLDSIFKRGVENASIGNIIKICTALHISVDELAEKKIVSRQVATTAPEEAELLSLYRNLTQEGKTLVLNTVRTFAGNPDLQYNYQSAAAIARQYADAADNQQAEPNTEAHA